MPSRPLTNRMLKRRVAKWGYLSSYTKELIVVVFEDGKMALVDVETMKYSSIRAWNLQTRDYYSRIAGIEARDTTLADLIDKLKPAAPLGPDPF